MQINASHILYPPISSHSIAPVKSQGHNIQSGKLPVLPVPQQKDASSLIYPCPFHSIPLGGTRGTPSWRHAMVALVDTGHGTLDFFLPVWDLSVCLGHFCGDFDVTLTLVVLTGGPPGAPGSRCRTVLGDRESSTSIATGERRGEVPEATGRPWWGQVGEEDWRRTRWKNTPNHRNTCGM